MPLKINNFFSKSLKFSICVFDYKEDKEWMAGFTGICTFYFFRIIIISIFILFLLINCETTKQTTKESVENKMLEAQKSLNCYENSKYTYAIMPIKKDAYNATFELIDYFKSQCFQVAPIEKVLKIINKGNITFSDTLLENYGKYLKIGESLKANFVVYGTIISEMQEFIPPPNPLLDPKTSPYYRNTALMYGTNIAESVIKSYMQDEYEKDYEEAQSSSGTYIYVRYSIINIHTGKIIESNKQKYIKKL